MAEILGDTDSIILLFGVSLAMAAILMVVWFWLRQGKTQNQLRDSVQARTQELEQEKAKIEEERDQFSAILSSMGEGLLVFDKNHKTILMNQAASILLRTASKEGGWEARQILQFSRGEQASLDIDQLINRVMVQTDIITIGLEDNVHCKNRAGVFFPIAFVLVPLLRKGEVVGAVLVFRDVTKAKEIDRARTEFISLASHQLRGPLAALRLFCEMLLDQQVGKLTRMQREYLSNIQEAGQRMIQLVNALLSVARLETERVRVKPTSIELEDFIEDIIAREQSLIGVKPCTISLEKPAFKLFPVSVDPDLLRQVLENLIENAVKYSPAERCVVTIGVKRREEMNDVLIWVRDQGIGIPKDAQGRIFEKFFRADNAIKLDAQGSGLGLYIVKMITESAGGKLWFESEEGKGSTFYVTIPIKEAEKNEKDGQKGGP